MIRTTLLSTTLMTLAFAGSAFAYKAPALIDAPHHSGVMVQAASSSSDEVLKGATSFINKVSERGLAFLSDKNLSQEQRKKEFRKLLQDSFDLQTIGKFALGRYWRTASPEQRKEYLKLFEDMVIDTYAKRFEEYQGQQIKVGKASPVGSKGDSLVHSAIVSAGAPEVSVEWRVRNEGNTYRVIDVLVEGVSMSVTQRSEFSAIIQRGGGNIESLLQKLRSR